MAKHNDKVQDPFHKNGGMITRQQLRVLKARHNRRVQNQQSQQNQQAQAGNDPSKVTAPLTPNTLAAETASAQQMKYGPQETQYGQQIANSDAQQGRISTWFNEYLQKVAEARQQTDAAYAQAQANVQAQDAALNQSSQNQQSQVAQQNTAQQNLTGNAGDPNLAAQAAQASTARQALTNSFGAMLSTQGAAASTRGAERGAIGSLQALQAHQTESGHRAQILQQLQATEAEKGAFGVQYGADARDKERKYLLEQAAFGLNEQKAATDAADTANDNQQAATNADNANKNAAAGRKTTRQNNKSSQKTQRVNSERTQAQKIADRKQRDADQKRRAAETHRHNVAQENKKSGSGGGSSSGGSSGLTPTQRRASNQSLAKAQALARQSGKLNSANSQAAVDKLVAKGIPRVLASIAVRQQVGLPVGPGLVAAARKLGVRVSQSGAKKSTASKSNPSAVPGVGQV